MNTLADFHLPARTKCSRGVLPKLARDADIASKLMEKEVEICRVHVSRLTETEVDCVSKNNLLKESMYGLVVGTKSLGC